MLVTAALIMPAAGMFARNSFATPPGVAESAHVVYVLDLLLAIWTGLNVIFVSGDLFNSFSRSRF